MVGAWKAMGAPLLRASRLVSHYDEGLPASMEDVTFDDVTVSETHCGRATS
jgi:hypothetical protein